MTNDLQRVIVSDWWFFAHKVKDPRLKPRADPTWQPPASILHMWLRWKCLIESCCVWTAEQTGRFSENRLQTFFKVLSSVFHPSDETTGFKGPEPRAADDPERLVAGKHRTDRYGLFSQSWDYLWKYSVITPLTALCMSPAAIKRRRRRDGSPTERLQKERAPPLCSAAPPSLSTSRKLLHPKQPNSSTGETQQEQEVVGAPHRWTRK